MFLGLTIGIVKQSEAYLLETLILPLSAIVNGQLFFI